MTGNVAYMSARRATATVQRFHGALTQAQVAIDFSSELYNQKRNAEVDSQIERIWKEKTAHNKHLYDGSKFRLAGYEYSGGKLRLKIGLTSYKDLCGTNLAPNVDEYLIHGLTDHGDREAYLSQTLGVGILLLTSDLQLVLLLRSLWTAEASGEWDRPGGHPEPASVSLLDQGGRSQGSGRSTEAWAAAVNEAVLSEIWGSPIAEAVDEVGLPPSCLSASNVSLIGLTRNEDKGGRPSLQFCARLPLCAAEVRTAYSAGRHAEADESTRLLLVPQPAIVSLIKLMKLKYTQETSSDNEGAASVTRPATEGSPPDAATRQDTPEEGSRFQAPDEEIQVVDGEKLQDIVQNSAPALIGSMLLAEEFLTRSVAE